MATFTSTDDLAGAEFTGVDLRGSRFVDSRLDGAVLRGVDVHGVEIDAPWLLEERASLWVNGVDVTSYVDGELDRRFPGRSLRHASDPAALVEAWAAVERQWEATLAQVAQLPAGSADRSIDDEWSFAQTLRHLVMATDLWLGATVLRIEQPFHRVGLPNAEAEQDGLDLDVFSGASPSYDEVLDARASRLAMVRNFIARATPEMLAEPRRNPWSPDHEVTVLHCVQVLLREEWEHHRFAVRDLAVIETGTGGVGPGV